MVVRAIRRTIVSLGSILMALFICSLLTSCGQSTWEARGRKKGWLSDHDTTITVTDTMYVVTHKRDTVIKYKESTLDSSFSNPTDSFYVVVEDSNVKAELIRYKNLYRLRSTCKEQEVRISLMDKEITRLKEQLRIKQTVITREVEKPLSWFNKLMVSFGKVFSGLLVAFIGFGIFRLIRFFKPI